MQPINEFRANIGPRHVRVTGEELAVFFSTFDKKIADEIPPLKDARITAIEQLFFSMDGVTPSIRKDALRGNPDERSRIQHIREHSSVPIIEENSRFFHGRTKAHFIIDKNHPRQEQLFSLLLTLDSDIVFLREIFETLPPQKSFSVVCLLDNIRFKLLIILEDLFESTEIIKDRSQHKNRVLDTVDKAVNIYYSYLLADAIHPVKRSAVVELIQEVQWLCNFYLTRTLALQELRGKVPGTGRRRKDELKEIKLRWFKEAEHSLDTLMFVSKLMQRIDEAGLRIDVLVGIRFGGIELPMIVRHQYKASHLHVPEMRFVKAYSYHQGPSKPRTLPAATRTSVDVPPLIDFKGKNVLLLDDNITTGRGLESVVQVIAPVAAKLYFGCIGYSSWKRQGHFEMDGQGIVNRNVLEAAVVLRQTRFTRPKSRKFTNERGVFDPYKTRVTKQVESKSGIFGADAIQKLPNSVLYVCHKADLPKARVTKTIQQIRSSAQSDGFEVVDDWIESRARLVDGVYRYLDPSGHDFLGEAIAGIRRADRIHLIIEKESVYVRILYLVARYFGRQVIVIGSNLAQLRRHYPEDDGCRVVSFTGWQKQHSKHA